MQDRLDDVDARLREVERTVADLRGRLDQLEPLPRVPEPPPASVIAAPIAPVWRFDAAGWISLAGRTLVVLGGAYLLRALTQSNRLPDTAGIALGLSYAVLWLAAAEYSRSRQPLARSSHGLAGLLVGLPLLWEASARFQVFDANTSAVALAGVSGLSLGVAGHHNLKGLAFAATAGSIVTLFALAFTTGRPIAYMGPALLLGAATWWLGERRDWRALRWLAAFGLDLLLLGLISRATLDPPLETPLLVLVLVTAVVVASVGAFAVKTLQGRGISAFETVQTAVVLSIGIGGAAAIGHDRSAVATATIGAGALLLSAAAYAIPVLAGDGARSRNGRRYFTTIGFVFLWSGITMAFPEPARSVWLLLAALAGAIAYTRDGRSLWLAQMTILILTACVTTGVAGFTMRVWLPGSRTWGMTTAIGWAPALTAAVMAAIIRRSSPDAGRSRAVFRTLLLAIALGSVMTAAVPLATGALPRVAVDLGRLATIKSCVLAVTAIGLVLSRRRVGVEARWLTIALLSAAGMKLLVEDVWWSAPSTLFVALAANGAALLVAAKDARAGRS